MSTRAPRLRELEVFRAVLSRRSVTEAARSLGVSQPAVSRVLRQVEQAVGFRLFVRSGAGLNPTAEAIALLPALDSVFAAVGSFAEAGAALREGRAGQVTIGAVPALASTVVPLAIATTLERHPGLRVSVQIGVTRDIVGAVARGAADVGLVHDILEDPLVTAEELGAAHVGCVVPRDHTFATRRMVEARDLRAMPYVSYPPHSPLSDRVAAAFAEVGETYVPRIDAAASTTICAIVTSTGMPGLIEDYVIALGWWKELRVVPLAPPVPLRPRLLVPKRRAISGAATALAEASAKTVMDVLTRQAYRVTAPTLPRVRTGGAPLPGHRPSGNGDGR